MRSKLLFFIALNTSNGNTLLNKSVIFVGVENSRDTNNNFKKSVYWPYNNIFNSNYNTKFTDYNNCNIVI